MDNHVQLIFFHPNRLCNLLDEFSRKSLTEDKDSNNNLIMASIQILGEEDG